MAQRVYFPQTTAAEVSPAFEAWGGTTSAVRRALALTKGASSIADGPFITVDPDLTAGANSLDRQYVSEALAAGIVMSGTVKGQLNVREQALNDNINQLQIAIKVVSNDGSTVQATLLPRGAYGDTAEFNITTSRNTRLANGAAVTPYTTVAGDRLVIEVGYATSGGGQTMKALARWGEDGTDLPEDTTTIDQTMAGWMEFSWDFVPAGTPTRFYFDQDLSAEAELPEPFTPALDVEWDSVATNGPDRVLSPPNKDGATALIGYGSPLNLDGSGESAWAQFITPPLDSDQTISGSLNVVISASHFDDTGLVRPAFILRVIAPNGTIRGVLASELTSGAALGAVQETRSWSGIALTPVDALAGDFLVMEVGFHSSAADGDLFATLYYGGTSLADAALSDGQTDDLATWWELSQSLDLDLAASTGHGAAVATLSPFTTSAVATQTFEGSGAVVATLSAFATGTASSVAGTTGSGAAVATLSAFATGSATQTAFIITASGVARRRLSAFTSNAVASNPDSPVLARRRAKGGGSMRFIQMSDPEEPKKPARKRKKRRPTPEAAELPAPTARPIDLTGYSPEALRAVIARLPAPELPPVEPKAPEAPPEPKGTVEDRLLQHFIDSLGVQMSDDEKDMPYLLQRFLRMGH